MRIPALVLLVLAGADKIHALEVYRWTDEGGQVHYSDRARQGRNAESVDVTPASGNAAPYQASGLRAAERRLLELAGRREKALRQSRRHSVSKYAAGKSRCAAARGRYDRAKIKPGAARSLQVKKFYAMMRELCR